MICRIEVKKGYCYFSDGSNFYIKQKVSDKLQRLVKIKSFDRQGYLTIDCIYKGMGVIEEYFDINYSLKLLGISTDIISEIDNYVLKPVVEISPYLGLSSWESKIFVDDDVEYIRIYSQRRPECAACYVKKSGLLVHTTMPELMFFVYGNVFNKYFDNGICTDI